MKTAQFSVEIDFEACTLCGSCLELCPGNVFAPGKKKNQAGVCPVAAENPGECVGCLLCAESCPEGCVTVAPAGE